MLSPQCLENALKNGCYFSQSHADRICTFAETYYIPQFVTGKFRLLPWQREWLSDLEGWRMRDGSRKHKKALLTCAKKNGKDLLCGILSLYNLIGTDTPSPIVISASTTRDNATSLWKELSHCLNAHPRLKSKPKGWAKLTPSQKRIRIPSKNAEFVAISNDSGNCEGVNASFVVCNEVHAWGSDDLFNSLEYATAARPDACTVIISTSSDDPSHFYTSRLLAKARNVLSGDDDDLHFFPSIWEAPIGADDDDPATWRMANPSISCSFTEASFKADLEAARKDSAAWISFQRYRLNRLVQKHNCFIDPLDFDRCVSARPHNLRDYPLVASFDLSQTTDTCAVACCWSLPDRRYWLETHAWVCDEGVRKREKSLLPGYRRWEQEGGLTITPGSVNDYRRIREYLYRLREQYDLREIVCDQWNAIEMSTALMSDGFTVKRQPQNHAAYTSPMKEFECAVKERRLAHDGRNSMLRWCLANTVTDIDASGGIKPSRKKSTDKIDIAVASIMAFGRSVETAASTRFKRSVYDTRSSILV